MLFAKDQDMIQAIAPEASLPLRDHRRPAFFELERVSQLLKDTDVLIPARVLEACRQAQGEFLIGAALLDNGHDAIHKEALAGPRKNRGRRKNFNDTKLAYSPRRQKRSAARSKGG
jgi:hypothetical protein